MVLLSGRCSNCGWSDPNQQAPEPELPEQPSGSGGGATATSPFSAAPAASAFSAAIPGGLPPLAPSMPSAGWLGSAWAMPGASLPAPLPSSGPSAVLGDVGSLVQLWWQPGTPVAGTAFYLKFRLVSQTSPSLRVTLAVNCDDAQLRAMESVSLPAILREQQISLPFKPASAGEYRIDPILLLVEDQTSGKILGIWKVQHPLFVRATAKEQDRPQQIIINPFVGRDHEKIRTDPVRWDQLPLDAMPELLAPLALWRGQVGGIAGHAGQTIAEPRIRVCTNYAGITRNWFISSGQRLSFGRRGWQESAEPPGVVLRVLPQTPENARASLQISRDHFVCEFGKSGPAVQSVSSGRLTLDAKPLATGERAVLQERGRINIGGAIELAYHHTRSAWPERSPSVELLAALFGGDADGANTVVFQRLNNAPDTGYILVNSWLVFGDDGPVASRHDKPVLLLAYVADGNDESSRWLMLPLDAGSNLRRPSRHWIEVCPSQVFRSGRVTFTFSTFSDEDLKGRSGPASTGASTPVAAPASGRPQLDDLPASGADLEPHETKEALPRPADGPAGLTITASGASASVRLGALALPDQMANESEPQASSVPAGLAGPSSQELVQLAAYVIHAPHVQTNDLYRSVASKVVFCPAIDDPTLNAYAYVDAKQGAPVITILGGAACLSGLTGLAVAASRGTPKHLGEFFKVLGPSIVRCNGQLSPEANQLIAEQCGLMGSAGDIAAQKLARSYAAGMCIYVISHELGHIVLGHTMGEAQNLEISRNQEREADSFACSVVSSSPFADYLVAGGIAWQLAMVWCESASKQRTATTHPLALERLVSFIRSNEAQARELGVDLQSLTELLPAESRLDGLGGNLA